MTSLCHLGEIGPQPVGTRPCGSCDVRPSRIYSRLSQKQSVSAGEMYSTIVFVFLCFKFYNVAVFLVPFGLLSRIWDFNRTKWALAFVCGTSTSQVFRRLHVCRPADAVTDWRQEFLCSRTAAMEQPTDRDPEERH